MNPSGVSRHEYHKDGRIPRNQVLTLRMRGGQQVSKIISGKYSFSMDEGHFKIFDTAGFGVVESIERGLIGRIEIEAAEAKP